MTKPLLLAASFALVGIVDTFAAVPNRVIPQVKATAHYRGQFVEGDGDAKILAAINDAFESTTATEHMACLPLLYKRDWNGFAEGPSWPCWWTQNSFGATYSLAPFMGEEPYATWIANAQDMWFRKMGDGKRKDSQGDVAPDGCLMDASYFHLSGGTENGFGDPRGYGPPLAHVKSAPINGAIVDSGCWYKQGDANRELTDWYVGGTVAGLIMEADRLLVRHDRLAAASRLGQLKRVAAFLDSRRDPVTNLIKGGHNSNLLAPTYRGVRKPDGSFEMGYLSELSVNYVAGLERLSEVCVLCDDSRSAAGYRLTAARVRRALPMLMTSKGYFIKSKDSDGVHGVFGAATHGYFEAHPNHDAGAFRVNSDLQNKVTVDYMLNKVKGPAAPGSLIPYGFVLPNYPGYDDHSGDGDMTYGFWNNGGAWPSNEGAMGIACFRAGEFSHPFVAWDAMHTLAQAFRNDSPLSNWGSTPWPGQLAKPYCYCYDDMGPAGGILRGLFEYGYSATGLKLWPHVPPSVTRYVQKFPASFGKTKVYLATTGTGAISQVLMDGRAVAVNSDGGVFLPLTGNKATVRVEFIFGSAQSSGVPVIPTMVNVPARSNRRFWMMDEGDNLEPVGRFLTELEKGGKGDTFEAGQARLVVQLITAYHRRQDLVRTGKVVVPDLSARKIPLADQQEILHRYLDTAKWVYGGLEDHLNGVSLQKAHVDPSIHKLAIEAGLIRAN